MRLNLNIGRDALKRLKRLHERRPNDYKIIRDTVERFIETGRADVRQVRPNLFRMRASRWRLYLFWDGDYVEILKIFHRSEEPYEPHVIRALVRDVKMLKEAARKTKAATSNRATFNGRICATSRLERDRTRNSARFSFPHILKSL